MSCRPFKTSEANAKAFLKTKGAIDNFLNIKDLNTFRKENAILKEQAKNKYFPNVKDWNEKIFFENREGTKAIPNKKVFKQIDNINGIYYSPTEQTVKTEKTVNSLAKATYFKDSDTKKASDVFTEISKSNYPLNKLAKKLLPYVKANDVDIELSNETFKFNLEDGTETTAAGVYDSNNNKVTLFKNEYFDNIEKLIIHEVLHSISAYQLKQDSETNNDFKKLFDYAKENIPKSYELENIDEFLVGIFTDSKFMKELQKLPAIEVKKYKNFLEEVIDYLLSLLKLTKGTTLYEQAFDIATNVLEESKQYSEMMKNEEEYMRKQIEEMDKYLYSPAKETTETKKDIVSSAIENQIEELIRKGIIKSKCD